MLHPLVTVIIPTYNRGACISQAISSVLAQTFDQFEIIVVDDGSTDNTEAVLQSFGSAIRVLRQKNSGVSNARNAGINAARGEWLAFLDSDDLWMPDKLMIQWNDIRVNPTAVAHAVDVDIADTEGNVLSLFELRGRRSEYSENPLRCNPLVEVLDCNFFTQAVIVRSDVVRRAGLFPASMRIHEDIFFLSRIALEGPFLVNLNAGVNLRRVSSLADTLSSIHLKNPIESHFNRCKLFAALLRDARLSSGERKITRRRLSGARFDLSEAHRQHGRTLEVFGLRGRSVLDDFGARSLIRAIFGRWDVRGGIMGNYRSVDRICSSRSAPQQFRRSDFDDAGTVQVPKNLLK